MQSKQLAVAGLVFFTVISVARLGPEGQRLCDRWGNGCTDCHWSFKDSTSTKPNNTWLDDKHDVHRRQMMTNLCGTCHVVNGDDPLLNESRGEPGLAGVELHGLPWRRPRSQHAKQRLVGCGTPVAPRQ